MKRSEMIERIMNYLLLNQVDPEDGWRPYAANLLDGLEQAGMLPPSYIEDPECIGSQVVNEWEPEEAQEGGA